jgi:uncharacterized protein YllA (UPF0747 family)
LPKRVLEELSSTRAVVDERLDALADAIEKEGAPIGAAVTGGLRANLMRRLDRFERRLITAAKKLHADAMQDIGTARGSLYPLGKPQERSLNFVPLLARYGPELRDEMLAHAGDHARQLLGDGKSTALLEEASTVRART